MSLSKQILSIILNEPLNKIDIENLSTERKALIGEELAKDLSQEELKDLVKDTRVDYVSAKSGKSWAKVTLGLGIAITGTRLDNNYMHNSMVYGGLVYSAINLIEIPFNIGRAYIATKLEKRLNKK